ncbi:hypothetical protein C8F04DRAFT_409145 [Mycena alexandri]|uniref:PHD-type domain-containing protein n=1 Tax=Mycena alexandri TaxID=1745969 RepID=A0AAD6X6J6_9AGAR|nr:hypothetical protein C8F04DRAFT_409145 [Mycena alexandri]
MSPMSAQTPRADQGPDLFSQTAPPIPVDSQRSLSSPSEGGMPAFQPGRTHLPTPQSPDYMGQYLNLQAPESPLAQTSYMYSTLGRASYGMPLQKPGPTTAMLGHSPQQQPLTPETSPYTPRYDSSRYMTPTIPQFNPHSANFATPRAVSSAAFPSPVTAIRPPSRLTTPPPSVPSPANLSSPFLDKLTLADKAGTSFSRPGSSRPTSNQIPVHIDDIFSSSTSSSTPSSTQPTPVPSSSSSSVQTSTRPFSPYSSAPPPSLPLAAPTPVPGGEMERIRQAMMQNHLAQYQEAEARRPDYLRRAKRPLSPPAPTDDEGSRRPGVGIMDSPHKGRRITLFQETSDESFEESLMAGGYGRYRTADWVRQPQPMAPTPGPPGPSTAAKPLEELQPPRPPTEKELRKRKRLEAFQTNETTNTTSDPHTSKLFPVNVEVLGRILVDAVSEEHGFAPSAVDSSPTKNLGGGKRVMAVNNSNKKTTKKKTQEPSAREKKAALIAAAALEDASDKPNWPDAEFPWRLRSEERAEMTKEDDDHRMQMLENFFGRDTDVEDGSDEEQGNGGDDEDLLDPAEWSRVYEPGAQRPIPTRGGRGKMVQLSADPLVNRPVGGGAKRSRFFPTDPGDARAALLAKKSVRSLAFRQKRRERAQGPGADTEEVECICRGKYDDAGQVVQCDICQTWYHLHCIGIRSIKDLGPEEDPWFCEKCIVVERSESSESDNEEARAPEPTFVPTDNEPPRAIHSSDTPIFQPSALQESPMPWMPSTPKTPTRSPANPRTDFGSFSSMSSSGSRVLLTPQGPSSSSPLRRSSVQIYGRDTLGLLDMDDVFDPTSTPSRGIKFGGVGAFTTTPKNLTWPTRPNGLFETPSRRRDSSSRLFGAPGTLDESAGGGGFSSPFGLRMAAYDDSPIRRDTAPVGDGQRARAGRLLDSPMAPSVGGTGRYLGHVMTLEDSPVMWSTKGKERSHGAP